MLGVSLNNIAAHLGLLDGAIRKKCERINQDSDQRWADRVLESYQISSAHFRSPYKISDRIYPNSRANAER